MESLNVGEDTFNFYLLTKGVFSKSWSILVVDDGVDIFLLAAVYSIVYVSVIVAKQLDS